MSNRPIKQSYDVTVINQLILEQPSSIGYRTEKTILVSFEEGIEAKLIEQVLKRKHIHLIQQSLNDLMNYGRVTLSNNQTLYLKSEEKEF